MREHVGSRSNRLPWKWFAAAAAGGVPVGLFWWLLAPGGLNLITRNPALAAGTNPEVWLPRDLTLAGLSVLAGCLVAVFLPDKGGRDAQAALLLGVAGGAAGAVIAWQAGMLAGQLWGGPVDTSVSTSFAFSLRSFPVLLLWPAATAASVFLLGVVRLLGSGSATGAGSAGSPVAQGNAPAA